MQDISKRATVGGKHAKWKTKKSLQSSWISENFQEKSWWTDKRHTPQENVCSSTKIFIEDEQFQKEKKCETGRKRSDKKVFIWSNVSKTPREGDTEISSSSSFPKSMENGRRKKKLVKFFGSEVKRKWFWFVFRSYLQRKSRFAFEIYLGKDFTRQNRNNPKQPTNENISFSTGNFNACLKLSAELLAFCLWDLPNFSKYFFVWFWSQIWFSIFCFLLWWQLSLGCASFFAHLSYLLRTNWFAVYIYTAKSVGKKDSCFKEGSWAKIRILTLKLKAFLEPEKVFRDTRRVLLDPNESSWMLFTIWIELQMKNFQTAVSPKNEVGQRSKNRQFWRYFPRFAKINGLDELVVVMSWGPQALRNCILRWMTGLQSLRYIRNIIKKYWKIKLGGGGQKAL